MCVRLDAVASLLTGLQLTCSSTPMYARPAKPTLGGSARSLNRWRLTQHHCTMYSKQQQAEPSSGHIAVPKSLILALQAVSLLQQAYGTVPERLRARNEYAQERACSSHMSTHAHLVQSLAQHASEEVIQGQGVRRAPYRSWVGVQLLVLCGFPQAPATSSVYLFYLSFFFFFFFLGRGGKGNRILLQQCHAPALVRHARPENRGGLCVARTGGLEMPGHFRGACLRQPSYCNSDGHPMASALARPCWRPALSRRCREQPGGNAA